MKRWLLVSILFITGITLLGCGDENSESTAQESEKDVFTESDFEKIEEMVSFLDERMEVFEKEANKSIQNGTIKTGDNDVFSESVRELGHEAVIVPFLEKYPNSLVARNSELIPITFESTSSEPCGFGNCTYDKVNILEVNYNLDTNEVYESTEFNASQLIFPEVQMKYEEQAEEEKETAIMSFVKAENGDLIFSGSPFLHVETLNFKEYDEEFNSIKTSVPESEVEAEQAEYKEEVEETLSKFPELQ
ncbi:hypothetical protein [Planomicrobium okeanokoites]|uniref:hypothetical protein n=1 Tax=Planomicrobium okeanokoites TaxID=244 RepID=UPI003562CA25